MITAFKVKKKVTLWCVASLTLLVILISVLLGMRSMAKERAFERLIAKKPVSVELVAYGQRRSVFNNGAYVITFIITEQELLKLTSQQSYVPVDIEPDPVQWNLELCNSVIKSLGILDTKIDASFDCYSKNTTWTQRRIFFDKKKELAVFIGCGNYSK